MSVLVSSTKPGAALLSQLSGRPMLPLAYAASRLQGVQEVAGVLERVLHEPYRRGRAALLGNSL